MSLIKRTVEFMRRLHALEPGSRYLLAVSGGLDSVAMTSIFADLSRRWRLEARCAYIHHGLRTEADEEREFVRSLAERYGMEFLTETVDVHAARKNGESIQQVARMLRYQALERIRAAVGAEWICTAHHADDQAETLIARFLQGSGIRGLTGIRPKYERVIRPLLFAERIEIEDYAKSRSLTWREDSSNATDKYIRNAIRHHVIPAVKQYVNPGLANSLTDTATLFSTLDEFLNHRVKEMRDECVTESDRGACLALHILNRYFEFERMLLVWDILSHNQDSQPAYDAVQSVLSLQSNQTGSKVALGNGYTAYREHDTICIAKKAGFPPVERTIEIDAALKTSFGVFCATRVALRDVAMSDDPMTEYVDADTIGTILMIRPWKAGDAFVPLGMSALVKLSDFLTSRKIAARRKSSMHVLEGDGNIIWVCGVKLDDRCKITAETKNVIRLQLKQED